MRARLLATAYPPALYFSFWCLAGSVAVLAVTWLAWLIHLNLTAAAFLQLLIVLAIALRSGFGEATVVSLFGNGCLNYFLVPPLRTLIVSDPQNWLALGVIETSALVVSQLSIRASQQAAQAASRGAESQHLYEISRAMLLLSRGGALTSQLLTLVERTYSLNAIALFLASEPTLKALGEGAQLESEVRGAYFQDRDSQSGASWIRVLRVGVRPIGAIGFSGEGLTSMTANALASLIALTLERERSCERETEAEAEAKSEQLRSSVLEALGHEYKTPLTALSAAAGGLLAMGQLSPVQHELVSLIDSQVERLNGLTTRLLKTSRLDRADIQLRPERIDPDELIQSILMGAQHLFNGQPVRVEGLDSGALINGDRELIGMALTQLLDNAAKYSDPASPITLSIESAPGEVRLSVHNLGPAIPVEERERIYRRFHRSPISSHRAPGTGIGLSIVHKVAEAHQGRTWVASEKDQGTTFFLAFPSAKDTEGRHSSRGTHLYSLRTGRERS